MLKLLLVDDEKLARDRLRRLLDASRFEVVGEAANGREAIEQTQQLQPDILLMDIRMPGMDGLEAAAHLARLESPPAVIFCTAYDEYALQAFDVQAVGYVLKPVRKEQLNVALANAGRLTGKQLAAIAAEEKVGRSHLSIKTHLGIELIEINEISHFMADQKYVTAFVGERELVLDDSLKQLETEFGAQFLRIHRNCLVSTRWVEGLLRNTAGKSEVKLRNHDKMLPVSRRHLTQVKKALESL